MAWNSHLTDGSVPIPARISHALQCLLIFPALPLGLIFVLPMIFGEGIRLMMFFLIYPWVLVSLFAHGILLHKERKAARHGLLSRQRYLRLQLWKLGWSTLAYLPTLIITIAMPWMRDGMQLMLRREWFWRSVLGCNIAHWGFIIVNLLYANFIYSGQVEGTIRLRADSPIDINMGNGSETSNDEAIARSLQALEPEWQV